MIDQLRCGDCGGPLVAGEGFLRCAICGLTLKLDRLMKRLRAREANLAMPSADEQWPRSVDQ